MKSIKTPPFLLILVVAALLSDLTTPSVAQSVKKPLKAFILAGQSNMEGHAKLSSFDHIGLDPRTAPLLKEMRADDGTPRVCEKAWISYFTGPGEGGEGFGKLTAGYGARSDPKKDGGKIGPEFTFGIHMQKSLNEPILIIKTAWGGKSLNTDFRSPSGGPYQFNEQQLERFKKQGVDVEKAKAEKAEATGRYYRLMIEHVKHVLKDPKRVCPDYDPDQGYELAGFVWFQGWNDMVDQGTYPNRSQPGGYDLYSKLMAHFIRDVRQDLAAPKMPFVIGVMGIGGPVDQYKENAQRYKSTHDNFRKAMAAPADMPEFKDNVTAVLTEKYWDPELVAVVEKRGMVNSKAKTLRAENQGYPEKNGTISPAAQAKIVEKFSQEAYTPRDLELLKGITNAEYHYLGSAKILAQIGKGFAEALLAAEAHDDVNLNHPAQDSDRWLSYKGGDGPGKGKQVVLIAAEQEYRSEQAMPMMAKVLSEHHGFDCTVLFSVNDQGEVDPTLPAPFKDETKRHNIPGLENLADADCVIWMSRFMHLPDDQMQCFHDYFDSGKPLIALRTANHGFQRGKPYLKNGNAVSLREMLGGAFMGHHGGWHRESTRGIAVPENKTHPILIGVDDIWGTSDVYRCHDDNHPFPDDCQALVLGQPLINLKPEAPANTEKLPLPVAWTKTWIGNRGLSTKIFHFTMGSAEDFANAGVRRLTVNAVYWGLGMDQSITSNSSVDVIGNYIPLGAGFNYEKLGVQPHLPSYYQPGN